MDSDARGGSLARMKNPFLPVPLLFLSPPDSEFHDFLEEANRLVEREPGILVRIEADLDQHGKEKKAMRIRDEEWRAAKNLNLPAMKRVTKDIEPGALKLVGGRPRTAGYVVYMLLTGRGYFGGFKSTNGTTLLRESTTISVFLANQGISMPAGSTINELVNAVSNETRSAILDAQVRAVLNERWDDFQELQVDSTAVEGNTQWPNDSGLMVALVARLLHRGTKAQGFDLPAINEPRASTMLKKLKALNKQICMEAGKPGSARNRKKLYGKMLQLARKALGLLKYHVQKAEQALKTLDVMPSRHQMAATLVMWLRSDLQNLQKVIDCCEVRVMKECKVPAGEKVLSVSDPDAGFIVKGGREPVVGYKPQLGRSGTGFIVGLLLPQGNAADSTQLVSMVEQVAARTGVVPNIVSADDGYAAKKSRSRLLTKGVRVVSISGSKGKKITPENDWNDEEHRAARNDRSAVESLMFTLKHGFDFGRLARRGLKSVHAEMLEKTLAYNFCRMATRRHAGAEAAQPLAA